MTKVEDTREPAEANWIAVEDTATSRCPYLAGRRMRLRAVLSFDLDPRQFDACLALGYRRTGVILYRPDCPAGCRECVPIRLSLAAFTPSRSQRRLLARTTPRVEVSLSPPRFDPRHLALYNRHARMVSADNKPCTPAEYKLVFVSSCVTTQLVEYRVEGKLAGLSVIDRGQTALSSFYFCWEPGLRELSLGTFSALWEMQWARREGLSHYYLGYWIAGCPSMSYKNRFRPYELRDWRSGKWVSHER